MMYSEFIEHSNFTEQYISYAEYTTYIEPIYMAAEQIPTKQEFIALLRDSFKSLVNPVVEKAIHSLSLNDKITYLVFLCCLLWSYLYDNPIHPAKLPTFY